MRICNEEVGVRDFDIDFFATNSAITDFVTIAVINTKDVTKSSFFHCTFENWEEPTHKHAKKIKITVHNFIHDMYHSASVTSSNYKD